MSKRSADQFSEFRIGFELEFVWPDSELMEGESLRRDARAFGSIRNSLRKFGCADLADELAFTEDGTIDTGPSGSGIEIVTPPWPGPEAMRKLELLLRWMQESPAKTNESAGLHINMSFADPDLNARTDYLALLDAIPQKKILRQFGREKNEHCEETSNAEISAAALVERIFGGDGEFVSFAEVRKALQSPAFSQKALKAAQDLYREELAGADKCIAIVEKNARGKKANRYFEFRMSGNEGYETRWKEFQKLIEIYAGGLRASLREGVGKPAANGAKPGRRR